jgi:hypothetical protein
LKGLARKRALLRRQRVGNPEEPRERKGHGEEEPELAGLVTIDGHGILSFG